MLLHLRLEGRDGRLEAPLPPLVLLLNGNCVKIGLPGKLILSRRKGLREVLRGVS